MTQPTSEPLNPNMKDLLKRPVHWLAFGFGSGLGPKFPGTWGTLACLPLFVLAAAYLSLWSYVALTVAMCVVGVYLCGKTAKDLGVHDHGGIVWDEFAGMFITLLPLCYAWPVLDSVSFWLILLIAFVLFRFFDIIKPWPIKWIDQHVHGGLGIMLDDIVAGAMAWGVLQLFLWMLSSVAV